MAGGGPVAAIALSGYGTPEDLECSAGAGLARHIVTPVSPANCWR